MGVAFVSLTNQRREMRFKIKRAARTVGMGLAAVIAAGPVASQDMVILHVAAAPDREVTRDGLRRLAMPGWRVAATGSAPAPGEPTEKSEPFENVVADKDVWEIGAGACAAGAFVAAYTAATATGPAVATGVGAVATGTAIVSAAAVGCGLGIATAAVSFAAAHGMRYLKGW